jgi:hypothetical protein
LVIIKPWTKLLVSEDVAKFSRAVFTPSPTTNNAPVLFVITPVTVNVPLSNWILLPKLVTNTLAALTVAFVIRNVLFVAAAAAVPPTWIAPKFVQNPP